VQNFPPSGDKLQISTAGGNEPQWRPDGKEMFYVQDDKMLMSVEISFASGRFEASIPQPLIEAPFSSGGRNRFVISPDGQKFLVITRVDQSTTTPFTLVLNWAAGLKREAVRKSVLATAIADLSDSRQKTTLPPKWISAQDSAGGTNAIPAF